MQGFELETKLELKNNAIFFNFTKNYYFILFFATQTKIEL